MTGQRDELPVPVKTGSHLPHAVKRAQWFSNCFLEARDFEEVLQ